MTFLSAKIKWMQHKPTAIVLLCILLVIVTSLFLRYDTAQAPFHQEQQHQDSVPWSSQLTSQALKRQSLYTPSMFIPDALQYNHFQSMTAIVLRTSEDQGIHHIVDYLHKYPYFKQICIYNLLFSQPLSPQAFERLNPWLLHSVDINIIEESEQDHDGMLALFTTCALSSYSHCYIQDDRAFNLHMDTLYTHFMRYPDLIHVNAPTEEYHTHRRWQLHYQDDNISLHTGYANLRYGAIIPRSKAQLFINQFAVQKTVLYQKRMANVFFSFWTNSYPYILSNPLSVATHQQSPYHQMLNAIRRLERAMSEKTPYFSQTEIESPPLEQRDVRTSCENDKCLFVTNLDPFPTSTKYERTQNLTNSSLGSPADWQRELEVDIPGPEFWLYRGYHAAVDGDSGTCWNSYLVPKEGDYFGLDLVGNMRASRLVILLRQPMDQPPANAFNVRALYQSNEWVDCPITVDTTQSLPRRLVYQMRCPEGKVVNAIRLFFTQSHQRPFDLCGLGLDNFIV